MLNELKRAVVVEIERVHEMLNIVDIVSCYSGLVEYVVGVVVGRSRS